MNMEIQGSVLIAHMDESYSGLVEDAVRAAEHEIRSALEGVAGPRLVIDMSQTQYFSSFFLEMMIRTWHAVQAAGGQFVVAGLRPNCRLILTTSRFDRLWTIVDTVPEAVMMLER